MRAPTGCEKVLSEQLATPTAQLGKEGRELREVRTENKLLREKIDALLRRLFGASREQVDAAQLLLMRRGTEARGCGLRSPKSGTFARRALPPGGRGSGNSPNRSTTKPAIMRAPRRSSRRWTRCRNAPAPRRACWRMSLSENPATTGEAEGNREPGGWPSPAALPAEPIFLTRQRVRLPELQTMAPWMVRGQNVRHLQVVPRTAR